MARRLAQVARLGRLAWWTLSLPSLLWLGRLGREVAYIADLSKKSPHVRCRHHTDMQAGTSARAIEPSRSSWSLTCRNSSGPCPSLNGERLAAFISSLRSICVRGRVESLQRPVCWSLWNARTLHYAIHPDGKQARSSGSDVEI